MTDTPNPNMKRFAEEAIRRMGLPETAFLNGISEDWLEHVLEGAALCADCDVDDLSDEDIRMEVGRELSNLMEGSHL